LRKIAPPAAAPSPIMGASMSEPAPDAARVGALGIPADAARVRLYKIVSGELIACETIYFPDGAPAIDTVLRRAAISGRVEVGGEIADHFADALNDNGDLVETVALDARSYRALKTRWMKCRLQRHTPGGSDAP
jgi:hypothetical protein